jgi:uncharacterized protein (DUF1697 family)
VRRLPEGTPELTAEVRGRQVRGARESRDVERVAVPSVDEILRPQEMALQGQGHDGGFSYPPVVARQILLLRGINLGPRNRISMPDLREALADAGFDDIRTYLQSGNVVVSTTAAPAAVRRKVERLISDRFGLEIAVVVRTRAQLAAVVKRDPLGEIATDPKRYQVSFLDGKLGAAVARKLEEVAAPGEELVVSGREVFAWHPAGVARSKLWAMLAGKGLGVTATARNWTTVTQLLELAGD